MDMEKGVIRGIRPTGPKPIVADIKRAWEPTGCRDSGCSHPDCVADREEYRRRQRDALVTLRRRHVGQLRIAGDFRPAGTKRPDLAIELNQRCAIRAWAKQNGQRVSDRGRLSAEVLQAWQTAQAGVSHA